MHRLVALVTLKPDVDVLEHMRLLRQMATSEPNVLTAEVGLCQPPASGVSPVSTYVYTATFADRLAFEGYATGTARDDRHDRLHHQIEDTVSAFFEVNAEA
jgi:hypothetical protein